MFVEVLEGFANVIDLTDPGDERAPSPDISPIGQWRSNGVDGEHFCRFESVSSDPLVRREAHAGSDREPLQAMGAICPAPVAGDCRHRRFYL